jgi:hypothetical protein
MGNSVLTPTAVTRRAMKVLHGKLVLARKINRQYDSSFAQNGAKIGSTLKVRLPNKYTIRTGKAINAQDTTENSETITVATQIGVDSVFSTAELTMSIDDFSERILEPQMAIVASAIENAIAAQYVNVPNLVGTAGTTPASMLTILQAGARLDDNLVPRDGKRTVALSPTAMASMVDAYKGLFNAAGKVSDQYENGMIKDMASGFDWGVCPVINPQVNSAGVVTGITVNDSTISNGDTTVTVASTTTAYSAGTVVTFAGCYAVNDETKVAYPFLKQFVVVSATTTVLTISPAIYTSGPLQNCSAVPTDGGAVTVVGAASGSYPQHLAFHKDWCALVTADLEDVSKFGAWGARETYDGISMRVARQYDVNTDNIPCRIDVLYGVKQLRGELACRITG